LSQWYFAGFNFSFVFLSFFVVIMFPSVIQYVDIIYAVLSRKRFISVSFKCL
jgi:hypothetical protein